jgi:hypothetical protein
MEPARLTHLIYTSAASPKFDSADLRTILKDARDKNAARSITGMLLYTADSFFQVLEGEEAAVMDLFATIASDTRHKDVTKIIQEPIAQRAFADWSMGYSEADPSELEAIEGFSDFFGQGNSLPGLKPGRAKKLLAAFAQGRWRARLAAGAR